MKIKFPDEFNVGINIPKDLECLYKHNNDKELTRYDCSISDSSVLSIPLGVLKNGGSTINVGQIINPDGYPSSSCFSLCIYFNDVLNDCSDCFGRVVFSEKPKEIRLPTISQQTFNTISSGSTWLFSFYLTGSYEAGNSLRFTFPAGFHSEKIFCKLKDFDKAVYDTLILPDKRGVQCNNIDVPFNGKVQVSVVNIVTPSFSGLMQGFRIELMQGVTPIVLESIDFDGNIEILPGKINVTVERSDNYKMSNTSYTYVLFGEHPLDSDGKIEFVFSKEWNFWQNNCTVLQGVEAR